MYKLICKVANWSALASVLLYQSNNLLNILPDFCDLLLKKKKVDIPSQSWHWQKIMQNLPEVRFQYFVVFLVRGENFWKQQNGTDPDLMTRL